MYKFVTINAIECDQHGVKQFEEKVEIIIPIDQIIGITKFPNIITKDIPIKLNDRYFKDLEIKDIDKFKTIIF